MEAFGLLHFLQNLLTTTPATSEQTPQNQPTASDEKPQKAETKSQTSPEKPQNACLSFLERHDERAKRTKPLPNKRN